MLTGSLSLLAESVGMWMFLLSVDMVGSTKPNWRMEVHRTTQDAPQGENGASWCHCVAALYAFRKVVAIEVGSWWLGKGKHLPCLQEEDPGCYRLLRLPSVREKGRETCEATSGILCPVLASPVQEERWYTGASSMEGHKNGEVLEAQDVWEKAEKAGSFTSWGREGWRETLVLSTATYTIERRWGQTLLRGGPWQDKRQQMKEHGKFCFHMKIIFSCEGGQPPECILLEDL